MHFTVATIVGDVPENCLLGLSPTGNSGVTLGNATVYER